MIIIPDILLESAAKCNAEKGYCDLELFYLQGMQKVESSCSAKFVLLHCQQSDTLSALLSTLSTQLSSQSNMPWHFNRKANSIAVSFSLSNRPDCEKCPAPRSHLKSSMRLSVLCSLSLATNLAGSLHDTPTLTTHTVERRMSRNPISDDQWYKQL